MGRTQAGRPLTRAAADQRGQFDFRLGEWDLEWGDGETGTSSVYRDLDGHVLVESFDGRPSLDLQALSLTVWDGRTGRWRQTSVDNEGTWLVLSGGLEDGEMVLRTRDGRLRMRWHDICEDSLEWALERALAGGAAWEPLWEIAYRRVL